MVKVSPVRLLLSTKHWCCSWKVWKATWRSLNHWIALFTRCPLEVARTIRRVKTFREDLSPYYESPRDCYWYQTKVINEGVLLHPSCVRMLLLETSHVLCTVSAAFRKKLSVNSGPSCSAKGKISSLRSAPFSCVYIFLALAILSGVEKMKTREAERGFEWCLERPTNYGKCPDCYVSQAHD